MDHVKFVDDYNVPPEPQPEAPKKKKKLTKAEKKAKKLKEAQDFKMLETRDNLRRELELSKKSARRGMVQWEHLCKEIKSEELREELTYDMEKAQRELESKDVQIETLLEDWDTIDEMHRRGFAKHVEIMDFIIDIYKTFVEVTHQIYEEGCIQLIIQFYNEVAHRSQIRGSAKGNRENIMHGSNLLFERDLAMDLQIYQEKQDSRVNAEIAKRYRIRDSVIEEMKNLRKQLLNFIGTTVNTDLDPHKYENIDMLMERQRAFVVESQKLNGLELRNAKRQNELQRELLTIETDAHRKIMDLKMELGYFLQVRKRIERDIQTDRDETHERLRILASSSYEVMERYKKLEKKGELLLTLAASCRKLETEKEKVVPWIDLPGSDDEDETKYTEYENESFRIETLNLTKLLGVSEEDLANQARILKNFWRRVANVELQNMLLREKQRKLMAENEAYCERIRTMGNRSTDRDSDLLQLIKVEHVLPVASPCPSIKKATKKDRIPKIHRKSLNSASEIEKKIETVSIPKTNEEKNSDDKDDGLCHPAELVLVCPPSCHSQSSKGSLRSPFANCVTPCSQKKT